MDNPFSRERPPNDRVNVIRQNDAPAQPPGIRTIVTSLGKYRDGLLASGAVIYALGWLVWSIRANELGLGQVQPLSWNYLISGFFPVIIIILSYKIVTQWNKKFSEFEGIGWVNLVIAIITSAAVLIFWQGTIGDPRMFRGSVLYRFIILTLFSIGGLYYLNIIPRISGFGRFIISLGLLFYFGFVMWMYFEIYVSIPQEFGGAEPRCAVLDLRADSVSTETSRALGAAPNDPKINGSKEVTIFFHDNTELWLRPNGPGLWQVGGMVEMPRSAVGAIHWQDSCS